MITLTTPSLKKADNHQAWYLVDGTGLHLGRLAAVIARILQGKHKPTYVSYMDHGDYIVVVNADKIAYKPERPFYWHTGYPGGIKMRTAKQAMAGPYPHRVLEKAVQRMLPKTSLGRMMFKKLKAYAGDNHPHQAQNPQILPVAEWNAKNQRSRLE